MGQHRDEVAMRTKYLQSVAQAELPSVPVEEHIHPVQLSMRMENSASPADPEDGNAAGGDAGGNAGGDAAGEAAGDAGGDAAGKGGKVEDSNRHSVAKNVVVGVVGAAAIATGGF